MKIFQYHVDFTPYIDNIKVKYALISQACEEIGSQKTFDGGILYLSKLFAKKISTFTMERENMMTK